MQTIVRKQNGEINRKKTTKAAAIDALEQLESKGKKAKPEKPAVEAGKYKGTVCFNTPSGPKSMGVKALQHILDNQNDPLVQSLLNGTLEDRVEGGDA
jgi:hypothetical protein